MSLVQGLPMGVLVWKLEDESRDDSLRLVFANEAAAGLLGRDLRAAQGSPVGKVFPEVAAAHLRACTDVARTGDVGRSLSDAASGPDRLPPGAFSRLVLRLPGKCLAVLFERFTDDERTAREVQTLNSFLDSIIENIPAKVFVKDAETLRFHRLNRACEELLGKPREELLGKNDFDLFPREQAEFFEAKDRETLRSRRLVDVPEEPITTLDGQQRWLHTKKIPIFGAGDEPRFLLGISYDITDRKRTEEERHQVQRELEARVNERTAELTQVNAELRLEIAERQRAEEALHRSEEELRHSQKMEAIGRLAGGIAHDFNNLLSIILSYSSMMMKALPEADPLRSDAEQIAIAGQRARDLTRQLLAFSRRQMMLPEVLDLGQVVRVLEPMLRRVLGEDIELSILAERRTALVKADPGQMQQIIMNLVVNARDAMPEGGTLTIAISDVSLSAADVHGHEGARPGPHVELSVRDTGKGMSDETRARIFEPFFTTKPTGKGTGLGLSTVLGIVQQSGGHIRVASAIGRGSAFRIYLPATAETTVREAPPAQEPPAVTARKATPRPEGGSETILLVEDEGQVRVLVREILRRAGYDVIDAPNAAEAVRLAERHEGAIHLLLTDVVMPHIGGRELARRLTGERPRMRVLYMSGYTDEAIVEPGGVVDPTIAFLQKPITPDLLLDKVRDTLRRPLRG